VAAQDAHGLTDRQLLEEFTARKDQEAFSTLIKRHGSLVLGVCRHVLRQEQDAEDAFQAAFLILARKASTIRKGEALAGWLHGVAYRTAMKAKRDAARRRSHEARAKRTPPSEPCWEVAWREAQGVLDEEIQRLPEKNRTVFVLCCLEGCGRAEAARQLGVKEGTVWSRLAEARKQLQRRLGQRGIALSAVLGAATLSEHAISTPLLTATSQAALSFALGQVGSAVAGCAKAVALAEGVLQAMTSAKLKIATTVLLTISIACTGVGLIANQAGEAKADNRSKPDTKGAGPSKPVEKQQLGADCFGDPLPPGALVRMGTIRLRQPYPRMLFSPDGKTLTSAGADNTVRSWDVKKGKYLTGKQLEGTKELGLSAIALAPDRKALLVWKYSRKSMVVYNEATGKKLGSVPAGDDQVYRAALGPGGKAIAASTSPGKAQTIRLWDVKTGTERVLLEHKGHDEHVEFSPDGKLLAAAGRDALRIFDVATGKLLHTLIGEVEHVAFSSDSKRLASGDFNGIVKLWDVATEKEQAALQAKPAYDIQCLAFSPDGKMLAVGGQAGLRLWDVAERKVVQQFRDRMVYELAFAPDGKVLAASGLSHIRLWDVGTGKRLLSGGGHNGEVSSIALSPNGKVVASTSYSDGSLCLWDAGTGKLLHQPPGDNIAGRTACFSADGKLVASGGHDGFVHLWDTTSGRESHRLPIKALQPAGFNPWVDALCLSSDGKRLTALVRFDHSQLNVWDVSTGKLVTSRPFQSDGFESFTPDGTGITRQTADGMAIQDTVTGKYQVTFPGVVDLFPIAFTPDGKFVAVARRKMVVQGTEKEAGALKGIGERTGVSVEEVATGKEVVFVKTGETNILALSADGRLLATADYNLVRVWDVATGKEIDRRSRHQALPGGPAQAAITSVALLPGGRRLATGLMDGTILIWELAPQAAAVKVLDRKELDSLWVDLAADSAPKAYRAISALAVVPRKSVPLLKDRLRPVGEVDPKHVQKLLTDLDSEEFAVRDAAAKELTKLGDRIEPAVRRALEGKPSAEVRKRLEAILAAPLALPTGATLRTLRAIQVLEQIGTPEAQRVLTALAGGAPEARPTREARAALDRLARRSDSAP
jgi:RNA polymerase sigma factor (sigma-70 family)